MPIINAITSPAPAIITTVDNTGNLVFQNAGTTNMTLDVNQNAIHTGYISAPNTFGFKNRIINGGMVISQRGTSPTITGGGDYSLDRFGSYYSGNAFTSVQSTTAPAGFINSMLFTTTTASASPSYSFFYQRIEGLNCTDLGFGLATASTVTISFWVRSSVTGIYSIALANSAGDRAYTVQYTINSANTWEQKTMTIPGDTSGTWLTNNGIGLFLRWNMGTSTSGRLISPGSWQSANADGATGSTGANTWANTSGATFYITGVQLEKGSTATSFDYRPYGTELQLCQRYYQRQFPVRGGGAGTGTTGVSRVKAPLIVTMRASPTATISGTLNTYDGLAGGSITTLGSVWITPDLLEFDATFASGSTVTGKYNSIYNDASANTGALSTGGVIFSAEL